MLCSKSLGVRSWLAIGLLTTFHDSEIEIRKLSSLFKEEGRQVRPAKESGHVQNEKRGGEARARGAVFQARKLTVWLAVLDYERRRKS
jgi:hypothetical protein